MSRIPVEIEVRHGSFASQPLVYACLLGLTNAEALDHVEVIQGPNLPRRLAHFFDAETAFAIEDAMGLSDTAVLIFPQAGAIADSEHLILHGVVSGSRVVPS